MTDILEDGTATHADLAAKLLRDAANFFRTIAEQNPALSEAMMENAEIYEDIALLVEEDPTGIAD